MEEKQVVLCREDFQDFTIGEFPFDPEHTATGEYHYIVQEGYHGNWVDQVCNYTWNGNRSQLDYHRAGRGSLYGIHAN